MYYTAALFYMHLQALAEYVSPDLSLNRKLNYVFHFKTHDLLGIFFGVLKINMLWTSYKYTQHFLPSVMFIVISMQPVTKKAS